MKFVMKQMKLKIELKSDLICGSGEGWGNVIDTDVVYDSYGFPYIPAKRIKGLLKEACLELDEMGVNESCLANEIFGSDNEEGSDFVLTNAVLESIDDMKSYIDNCNIDEKKELNISNIINHYTNVRCQTAIDDNGIAKENSLRASRAITRGNVFFADIIFEDKYEEVIKNCCATIHHMGINRTRGFGDVKLSLEQFAVENKNNNKEFEVEDDCKYTLKLKLKNRSQLAIKTSRGDKSADYIPGGALLGFFAGQYLKNHDADKEFYSLFIKDDEEGLVFENAYVSDENWNEYLPTRMSLYKEKTGTEFLDQSIQIQNEDDNKIWTRVRNKYACVDSNNIIKPDKEMVYHHRRPTDKSVGHVIDNSGTDTGIFYQKEVISPDQHFIAKIQGNGKNLKKVFNPEMKYIHIGGSKHNQYGNVIIEDFELIPKPKKEEKIKSGNKVVCTLTSPLVMLDKKGESILDTKKLIEKFGFKNEPENNDDEKTKEQRSFVDYTQVGGYNAKWKLQKPSYTAFAAGTCFTGTLDKDTEKELQIGSFKHEGMGKIVVNIVEEIEKSIKDVEKNDDIENSNCYSKENMNIPENLKDIIVDSIKHKLRLKALEELKNDRPDRIITPTLIGRLLKMLENDSWLQFKADYEGIATVDKKDEVSRYINDVNDECNDIIDKSKLVKYMDENEIESFKDEFCMLILKDLFTLTKYERRNK